ncbi:thioesterase [Rhodococcoides trifolii]|uniref:Thioesterase n=1 Tax=Rhodococcoides trifolii TaxID=908250 RepID=A0A917D5W3_9NOCA|nr:thioesterase family protein [Rhodococcus trifolii]GGG10078.1 thioesterase [Rhodococcus trifolii]
MTSGKAGGRPELTGAYFVPVQSVREGYERFRATSHTVSVWADTMQHGAPPSALLTRALELCQPRAGARLSRITVEILGPVPVAEIESRAWVERPGSRVEMLGAELTARRPDGSDRVVARATGWRIALSDTTTAAHDADLSLRPGPSDCEAGWGFASDWHGGYLDSLEMRGSEAPDPTRGPGRVWAKPIVSLIDGEHYSPLTRLMSVADIANGVGARIDVGTWTFLNTDLSVHIYREPVGDWTGVLSETSIGPDGVGMCAAVLHDEVGPVGRSAQIVEVRRR